MHDIDSAINSWLETFEDRVLDERPTISDCDLRYALTLLRSGAEFVRDLWIEHNMITQSAGKPLGVFKNE